MNVRTTQDSEDCPRRRSALVARERARLDIDIAALSEVRFAEQGSLREDGAGYTFFWSKLPSPENCRTCHFVFQTASIPIQDNKFATVLSVYAPTLQDDTGVNEAFHRDLHCVNNGLSESSCSSE